MKYSETSTAIKIKTNFLFLTDIQKFLKLNNFKQFDIYYNVNHKSIYYMPNFFSDRFQQTI